MIGVETSKSRHFIKAEKPEEYTPESFDGEPGWLLADPLAKLGSIRSFVSGDPTGDRIRIKYFKRERDGALVARAWFGPGAEGPPGYAHGGSIAAVLDEAMGAAAWMNSHTVVIADLAVVFRCSVPLGTSATVEALITRRRGKKIWLRGRLLASDGAVFAEARGRFITLHFGRFAECRNDKTTIQRPELIPFDVGPTESSQRSEERALTGTT